jgi:hypothetical protein
VVSLLPYRAQLHPLWLALVLLAAQGIPLVWRRRWPIPVLIIIAGARVAYDQIGFGSRRCRSGPRSRLHRGRPLWPRVALADLRRGWRPGIAISEAAPGHNQPYDAIFQVMIFGTAWAAGVLSRAKRANLGSGGKPGRARRGRTRPACHPGGRRGARPDRP